MMAEIEVLLAMPRHPCNVYSSGTGFCCTSLHQADAMVYTNMVHHLPSPMPQVCPPVQAFKASVEGLQNDVRDKRSKTRVHVAFGYSGVGKSTIIDAQCRLWLDDSKYRHLPEGSHSATQVMITCSSTV